MPKNPLAELNALGGGDLGGLGLPAAPQQRRRRQQRQTADPLASLFAQAAPPVPEEPGFVEQWAPSVVRGAGALVGSTPGIGALGSGGAEVLAQLLEGRDLDLSDIATASALGFLGGGAVNAISKGMALGSPVQAALKAAPWAIAQPTVRSLAETGELPDPLDVAGNLAMTSGSAYGLAKLFGASGASKLGDGIMELEQTGSKGLGPITRKIRSGPAPVATPQIQQLAPDGPMSPRIDPYKVSYPDPFAPGGAAEGFANVPRVAEAGLNLPELRHAARSEDVAWKLLGKERDDALAENILFDARKKASDSGMMLEDSLPRESYSAPIPGGRQSMTSRWVEPDDVEDLTDPLEAALAQPVTPRPQAPMQAPQGQMAPGSIEEAIALAKKAEANWQSTGIPGIYSPELMPPELRVQGQGVPLGVEDRIRAGLDAKGAATAEAGDIVGNLLNPQAAPVEAAPSMQELTKLFGMMTETPNTTPGLAAGANYRKLKGAFAEGTTGLDNPDQFKTALTGSKQSVGARAQSLARAEGLPPGGFQNAPRAAEVPQPNANLEAARTRLAGIQNATAKQRFLDSLPVDMVRQLQAGENRGGAFARLMGSEGSGGLGGERGSIDPTLLARIGLGATGAAVGGATDPLDNPTLSAVAGGAIGAGLPSLAPLAARAAEKLSADPRATPEIQQFAQLAAQPGGLEEMAKSAISFIPTAMRGNLLMGQNLPANALVSPWVNQVRFGLERYLTGDPAGLDVLRDANPMVFFPRMKEQWGEAARLIGHEERGDGPMMGTAKNALEAFYAAPGTMMGAGDLSARQGIMGAGFSEETARKATQTFEPETKWGKAGVNYQRTAGTLGNLLFPFARTNINLLEQAAQRAPGVGLIAQSMRETPDDMKLQLLKQAFGAAHLGGGFVAGQHLEDWADALPGDEKANARLLKGLLSNASGPDAVLTNLGIGAGRAFDKGKTDPLQIAGAAGQAGVQDIPMPSGDILESWFRTMQAEPKKRTLPAGIAPSILRDFLTGRR